MDISFVIGTLFGTALTLTLIILTDNPKDESDRPRYQKVDLIRSNFIKKLALKAKAKPGVIVRPSQEDIIRRENPKLAEEEEEMRRAFNELGVKEDDRN